VKTKFSGYYSYVNDPISNTYRIDKKYNFEYFVGKKGVVLEVPNTSDYHLYKTAKTDKEGIGYWLSSEIEGPDYAVKLFRTSPSTEKIKKMIVDNFQNIDLAVCGFSIDTIKYPEYDKSEGNGYLVSDFFINKWVDYDLMIELCKKYRIPTLPVLYQGKLESEDMVKSFLGTPSKLSSTEPVSYIIVRVLHEDIDEYVTSRKAITIFGSEDAEKKENKTSATKEVEEVEEIEILNEVLDPLSDVNEVALNLINGGIAPIDSECFQKFLYKDEKKTENSKILGSVEEKSKVLTKKLKTIFDLWKSKAIEDFNNLIKEDPGVLFETNLFNIGSYFSEAFINYLAKSEYKETFQRMKRMFGEKKVEYEIKVICLTEAKEKYFGFNKNEEDTIFGYGG
jgi:hypothetical protein